MDEGGHEEGERFAGAGLRDADEVLAGQQVRPGLRLDRRRARKTLHVEDVFRLDDLFKLGT